MSFDFAGFDAAFPWFFPAGAFLFGTLVGSFLNVVIHRVPRGQSVVTPGSHCACGTPIAWYDNVPVLSWFILRGRARCCGRPYSFRYPAVEALTGGLFLLNWLQHPPAKALAGMLLLSLLIAAFFIDLDHMIIPDGITIGGALAGVMLSVLLPSLHVVAPGEPYAVAAVRSGFASVTGLLIGSGLLLWIALVAEALLRKEAMGFGDVKFLGLIGAFCGWPGAIFAIFGGAVIGTLWIALALLWQRVSGSSTAAAPPSETPDGAPAPLRFGAHVPFGPMLAMGATAYFLGAEDWVSFHLQQIVLLFQ